MPTSLADFAIVKALGQGVSGICRLVRRSADARLYALKELEMPSDQGEASAVLQEAAASNSAAHSQERAAMAKQVWRCLCPCALRMLSFDVPSLAHCRCFAPG